MQKIKKTKKEFWSIVTVHEPVMNDDPLLCFFTDSIHLAFRSYVDRNVKGEYKLEHPAVRQCCYCKKYFAKSKETFQKHVKKCTSIEGIVHSFENGKKKLFWNNFKYLGDFLLPYILILRRQWATVSLRIQKCL